ncbi:MAG: lectin [Pseudomonadota bacterium]
MRKSMSKFVLVGSALAAAVLAAGCASMASTGPMSFFISSTGSGKGADLGGIAGGDALCQRLATAAGAGGKTWRAYLSTPGTFPSATAPTIPAVNARDRIGNGPWYNAKGVLIARDLTHLHDGNNISKETALDERGNVVKGRGDNPNEHDILTGSRADGTAFAPQTDTTCKGWTSSTDGSAILGHHDRTGPTGDNWAKSWNFSHQSAGCSQQALNSTGGAGRLYCFAAN